MMTEPDKEQEKSILEVMRVIDHQVFRDIAHECGVFIVLRLGDGSGKEYVGRPGFYPKPLSCKPKTASNDVFLVIDGKFKKSYSKGLVVNPMVPGMVNAYNGQGRHVQSIDKWNKFNQRIAPLDDDLAKRKGVYTQKKGGGKQYAVQMQPESNHYGCVMYSPGGFPIPLSPEQVKHTTNILSRLDKDDASHTRFYDPYLPNGAYYLYGDYDLYAIVDKDDPSRNIVYPGTIGEESNNFGPKWEEVKRKFLERTGVPMIQHGSHEKYFGHSDCKDRKLMYYPDRETPPKLLSHKEMPALYDVEFGGRPMREQVASGIVDPFGRPVDPGNQAVQGLVDPYGRPIENT